MTAPPHPPPPPVPPQAPPGPPALRLLDRADVVALGGLDPVQGLDDVRSVLHLLRAGEAGMPAETSVPLAPAGPGGGRGGGEPGSPGGRAYALPAWVGGRFAAAGVKWTAHRRPGQDPWPAIVSTTLVNDLASGLPLGLVEAAELTATRTAAVSALALLHLATAPLRRVAVLGAGVQAGAHLAMLARLFPTLQEVRLWNRTAAGARRLAARQGGAAPWPLTARERLEDALEGADAVLACTAAPGPFLGPSAMAPGRLLVQAGCNEARFSAIDRADAVVADLWGSFKDTSAKSLFAMHRAGRFPRERLSAELADVVVDGWRPPAGAAVYVSSFGLNLFDVALAARVLRAAEPAGRGRTVTLFEGP